MLSITKRVFQRELMLLNQYRRLHDQMKNAANISWLVDLCSRRQSKIYAWTLLNDQEKIKKPNLTQSLGFKAQIENKRKNTITLIKELKELEAKHEEFLLEVLKEFHLDDMLKNNIEKELLPLCRSNARNLEEHISA